MSKLDTWELIGALTKLGIFLFLLAVANVIFWGGIIWMTLGALRFFGVV